MDDKMGPGEVKLLSVMSGADSAESIKLKDAEHLAEMVEEMGPVVSAREEGEIRKMVSEVTDDLSAEKTEVLTQVIKELAPVLDAETVVEVSNVVEETSEGEVKPEDVKHLAEMVEKLSDEVSLVRPSTRLGFSQFSRQNCQH